MRCLHGTIAGTVTDATGAVVPNAKVTVIDTSKGHYEDRAVQCRWPVYGQ